MAHCWNEFVCCPSSGNWAFHPDSKVVLFIFSWRLGWTVNILLPLHHAIVFPTFFCSTLTLRSLTSSMSLRSLISPCWVLFSSVSSDICWLFLERRDSFSSRRRRRASTCAYKQFKVSDDWSNVFISQIWVSCDNYHRIEWVRVNSSCTSVCKIAALCSLAVSDSLSTSTCCLLSENWLLRVSSLVLKANSSLSLRLRSCLACSIWVTHTRHEERGRSRRKKVRVCVYNV